MDQAQLLKVRSYLAELNLEENEISVFLYLNKHGRSSVLGISRGLDTGRTKLYALLERLLDKKVIVVHKRHYGTSYEAASLRSLEFLVAEIETQAEKLKRSLPSVIATLSEMRHKSPLGSRIIEYRGTDGLNQMNFHLNQADGLVQVFELARLDKHQGIDPQFARKLKEQWAEKKIQFRDLTNDPNRNFENEVTEFIPLDQVRYIDPEVFSIEFETYVYNDCVALLSYDNHDVFGVEIHNKALASQQKQIFNMLWQTGTKIES